MLSVFEGEQSKYQMYCYHLNITYYIQHFIESKCFFLQLFYKAWCIVKSKITAWKVSSFLTSSSSVSRSERTSHSAESIIY